MLVQACLNGALTKADHPAVPVTIDELCRDAAACAAVGAASIHLHPRDASGNERLDPDVVDHAVSRVRAACGVPISVSTGEWIEPDVRRRVEQIVAWRKPDAATVNLSEEGAIAVMQALATAGVGIDAGVGTVAEVERLASSGLAERIERVLVEPVDVDPAAAVDLVQRIHAALDLHGVAVPRQQHGDGRATWILLDDALRRGFESRIGLEDTFHEPDGTRTTGNEALVRAALARALE